MAAVRFLDKDGTFTLDKAENYSYLYLPVANEKGLKAAVTPDFGGDSKVDQNTFLMEPVSAENLHNNRSTRNFWCQIKGIGSWSVTGASAEAELNRFTEEQEESTLTAGFMWQTVTRSSEKYGLSAKVTSFAPLAHAAEIMQVEICNESKDARTITPVAAVPVYGRSADNIRDHRHVTSLLHRITVTTNGVCVRPTMSFDERGHKKNEMVYYVCGMDGEGNSPRDFYPTVDLFIGEGGSFTHPRAVLENRDGVKAGYHAEGKEAVGGIRFEESTLQPGEAKTYTVIIGVTDDTDEIRKVAADYATSAQVNKVLQKTQNYWQKKVNVKYYTGNQDFDNYMRWVSFQPILRRIYGCSFLPHHDYGKGGRGWRDLWQDCLALLLMNPSGVRQMILDNYGGVRMDGSNATIIGEKQGEFIADRNHITRVWMDHGFWPFLTTKLYIDQTGDIEILLKKVSYFKDRQVERGTAIDEEWDSAYGEIQKTEDNAVYYGSVLEHLLLQNLCAFYEVGDHNIIRLRGADWNDALDMAEEKGESVAFTCAYAGNLRQLADYLKALEKQCGCTEIEILEEMQMLLLDEDTLYTDIQAKQELLKTYTKKCRHNVSGRTVAVAIDELTESLYSKADWMMEYIRQKEWVNDGADHAWFNSYYDNHGNRVEGKYDNNVRMMLTGQVFAIMSGTADEKQVQAVCESADTYLYDKDAGGYRLNTNFHENKFDLGRMFGFAYGEKENGAVFSHMTVMYANALYQRGFIREGYKALQTLADTALDFDTSRIYPGIPEYFNAEGRGMYAYLTGAASWYMLTLITEVFGVKGSFGDLVIEPKLVKEQFDDNGNAGVHLEFAGNTFVIRYHNEEKKDYGAYQISEVAAMPELDIRMEGKKAVISKTSIEKSNGGCYTVNVILK